MKYSLIIAVLIPTLVAASGPAPKLREQKIALTENREVIVNVPDGFALVTGQDPSGFVAIKLSDASVDVRNDVQCMRAAEGKYAQGRARMELMHEMFVEYVDASTEKAMQFEELQPRTGSGTYCVFTDSKLLGKSD